MAKKDIEQIEMVNREGMVAIVSDATGYTRDAVREILEAEGLAKMELLAKGYSYKDHKIGRWDVDIKPEKKNAYDGVHKRRYTVPKKYIVKYVPLKLTKDALEELNKTIDS